MTAANLSASKSVPVMLGQVTQIYKSRCQLLIKSHTHIINAGAVQKVGVCAV